MKNSSVQTTSLWNGKIYAYKQYDSIDRETIGGLHFSIVW